MDSYNNALVSMRTSSLGKMYLQRKRLPSPCPETIQVQTIHFNNEGNRPKTIGWIMGHFNMKQSDAYAYFHNLCKYGEPIPCH